MWIPFDSHTSPERWCPELDIIDIYLYCSADGSYEVKLLTKAIVYHSGDILWRPPAIYKGRRIRNIDLNSTINKKSSRICIRNNNLY